MNQKIEEICEIGGEIARDIFMNALAPNGELRFWIKNPNREVTGERYERVRHSVKGILEKNIRFYKGEVQGHTNEQIDNYPYLRSFKERLTSAQKALEELDKGNRIRINLHDAMLFET